MNGEWGSDLVIRKKQARTNTLKNNSQLNAAAREGAILSTEKKLNVALGGLNKGKSTEGQRAAKIDRDTGENGFHINTVSGDLAKIIQQARQAKGWTQKELATKICEKPQVINEYESGKAKPNQQILAKMERNLGVKLRGKNIGEPLTFGKKK
ncbi:multi protein bridging factor 1-domain-containing protein [Neocallimastix lanati (nom. inval.)]|jgi:putative transcription factor|uniref:MBF1-domain-containing protein n=1 Tax=Neocallimastix californiae TaxID=1754190 RepID=A0A1Y2FTF4_9FUNG|nr:multi protein bridging factor 1-domain-containing protein [Neocallimastix sp. JGI-2020a]ORY87229.1 MBF1-domain-containing protein [Neocallimastix californiae]|eukprot:ORY87229.1 MBF1-domain-containing protein [Neocallimastix californiae]